MAGFPRRQPCLDQLRRGLNRDLHYALVMQARRPVRVSNRSVEPVLKALWQGRRCRLAHTHDPHPGLVLPEVDARQMRHRLLAQDHAAAARHIKAHRLAGGQDLGGENSACLRDAYGRPS